ncbi:MULTISPECIES: ParM/StbA family protein [Bacillaceae]|uniref:ParM/StbA family protein n=1 Tax=Evansella alkalicola TaxID=745819 RepID=A0ABS6K1D3_9BACI|nr:MULTISPECIES: ParM/StbA family protein [Bacillaceae]MBU9724111.1 ParM/StbA family protein [Bacillus alkalicola]
MSLNVEIDLGFGFTKGMYGSKVFREPSVIGEKKPLFPDNMRKGDIIYENEYFVGDLALRHSDVKFTSIKENKADSWISEILLKTVLGYLAPRESGLHLVTGLPIDYYFSQKDDFENMLNNINEQKPFHLDILNESDFMALPKIKKQKIILQPMGGVFDYLLNDDGEIENKEIASKTILVVDVGYYTLDLLILDGMEIHRLSCSPPELGVDTAYRLLQQYLKDKIGRSPARHDLNKVVLSGEYQDYNVTPLILKAFKTLATQIQNEIESFNMNFHLSIVTGGAAHLVSDYLTLRNKTVLEDPQMAILRGYRKIGRRTWGE